MIYMLVEIMNADDAQVSGHNQIRGRIAAACRAGDLKLVLSMTAPPLSQGDEKQH
jgi:hypothetical protein